MVRNLKEKFYCFFLTLVLVAVLLPSNLFTNKADALTMAYNTGTRDQVATSLSTDAKSYYSGSYSYSSLSSLSGSSLKSKLYSLMSSTMTKSVSYKSLTTYWPYTDAEKGKSGTVLFYSDEYSTSFNREHVWPKSRGSFYQINGGCDLHHLRPTNVTVNSTRGNHTMGNLNHSGTAVTYSGKTVGWLDNSADMFEPLDNVKGDVARIYLYMYVRWQQPNLYQDVPKSGLPAMDSDDSANDGQAVIESLDTLLSWIAQDPVDTWEMSRNDLTQDIQGNRNVFIDYPELAWKLFGKTVPSTLTTPSKNSGTTTTPSTKPSVAPSVAPSTAPSVAPSTAPVEEGVYKRISSVNEIGTGGQFVLVGVNGNYTRAMSNTIKSGRMTGKTVTISNNTITNPDASIVWTLKEQSTTDRYSLYNSATGKYLVIKANTTSGFALTSSPTYYFDATNATDKAANAIYLSTTATGKRNISIYQNDFRPYAKSNYYPLYLYKLS